jgi:hypothetical protein
VVTASETKVYVQPEFVGRRKQTESLAKMAMSLSHNQPDLQNWRDCFLITNLIPLLRLTVLGCENEVRSGSARCAWAIFFVVGPAGGAIFVLVPFRVVFVQERKSECLLFFSLCCC